MEVVVLASMAPVWVLLGDQSLAGVGQESRLGQDLHSQVVALHSQPGGQDSQYVLEVLLNLFLGVEDSYAHLSAQLLRGYLR